MKATEAKIGMRVYETEFGKEGTIVYKNPDDQYGCDVEFDDGEYTWIGFEDIDEVKIDRIMKRSEFKIGEFLYGIPTDGAEDYYKNTPSEEMVFIHNGYINGDGYGQLIGFVDGKVMKSTGWKNFMWGGDVRLATDEEKEAFMRKVMNQDSIKDY